MKGGKMDASAYAAIGIAVVMSLIAYGAYIIGKNNMTLKQGH